MRIRRAITVPVVAALTAAAGLVAAAAAMSASAATAGCSVTYSVSSQWPSGFTASVSLTNLGDPLTSWTLTWSFGAGQQVTQAWSATVTQSGAQVTAVNASYNGALATGANTSFGFNGSWDNSGPQLTDSLAKQAGADPTQNVTYVGQFHLPDSEVVSDGCHANAVGQDDLGKQARAFWG